MFQDIVLRGGVGASLGLRLGFGRAGVEREGGRMGGGGGSIGGEERREDGGE